MGFMLLGRGDGGEVDGVGGSGRGIGTRGIGALVMFRTGSGGGERSYLMPRLEVVDGVDRDGNGEL